MLPPVIVNEVLWAGRRLDAAEALRWGVVNSVVPGEELMQEARTLAHRVAESAPLAVAATMEIGAQTGHLALTEAFKLLRSGKMARYEAMLASEDAQEGPPSLHRGTAPPRWSGR